MNAEVDFIGRIMDYEIQLALVEYLISNGR
jgi:hypothetical protein